MSTRCQVIVKDQYSEVWFYRHSDGYPEGVLPTLSKFVDWMASGRIRADAMQGSGWLIIIGNHEYQEHGSAYPEPSTTSPYGGWKVGAYEPSQPKRQGDIEYLYTVDCQALTISVREVKGFGDTQKLGRAKVIYSGKRAQAAV